MSDEEEMYPALSALGWQFIEVVERMISLNFSMDDICDAWDITPKHVAVMLARANAEREMLFDELSE